MPSFRDSDAPIRVPFSRSMRIACAPPPRFADRPYHVRNRLIASAALTADERRDTAREIAGRLSEAKASGDFILPVQGIEEWDRVGQPAHDPSALRGHRPCNG